MSVAIQIALNKFKLRPFQIPIVDALENKGYRRVLACWPRRAGKDVTAFNYCIRYLLKNICVIYYIFPTYSQGRKILWESINNDGQRILEYIPPEVIESTNSQEMKIRFKNGSLFQVVGSDNFDSLVGTNPKGIVFSEYALQDPRAYQYLRPILAANDGWALFLSTPRGKNHFYELYQMAIHNPEWFVYKLSLDDTKHIPQIEIERERAEGIMSEDLIQQEYYTSFEMGVEGSYYAKYMDRMRLKGQIGMVPWEPAFKVHTAWDLGVRDSTCIIFFQAIGTTVRIIDCYDKNKEGLEHYVGVINSKPYSYGKHIAPHDIKVKEFGSGMTRLEKASQLGIKFIVAPDLSIMDGIESVRSSLAKIWIDEKCTPLIKALEGYRQEFDAKRRVYKSNPLHDQNSHYCFTSDTLVLTRTGIRQIIDVKDNDEVHTMNGWEKCIGAKSLRKNASLVRVTFADGVQAKCTPDHLFLTVDGWISAENLEGGTKIQSSLGQVENSGVRSTGYGDRNTINKHVAQDYITMSGNQLTVRYRQDATFTTSMAIEIGTHYLTWFVCQLKNIARYLGRITRVSPRIAAKEPLNGMEAKLDELGIVNTLKPSKTGKSRSGSRETVYSARKQPCSLPEKTIIRNSVIPTVKPLMVEQVERLEEKADVWCINVPDAKHFALSNGAIVHNSDCMRYLCITLPKTRDSMTAEEHEKRLQNVMMGPNANMPSVFRSDLPPY